MDQWMLLATLTQQQMLREAERQHRDNIAIKALKAAKRVVSPNLSSVHVEPVSTTTPTPCPQVTLA